MRRAIGVTEVPVFIFSLMVSLVPAIMAADRESEEYTKWKKAEVAGEVKKLESAIKMVGTDSLISSAERAKRAASLRRAIATLKRTDTTVPELGHIGEYGVGRLINAKATVTKIIGPEDVWIEIQFTVSSKPRKERGDDGPDSFYVMGGSRVKYPAVLHGIDTKAMAPAMAITLPSVIKISNGLENIDSEYVIEKWKP